MATATLRRRGRPNPNAVAIFRSIHKNGLGETLSDRIRHNLRTNAGADWQAQAMGGGAAIGTAATGTTGSAPTATTYTLTGVSAPGSTSAYNGYMLVVGAVYGVVLSNTNASPPVVTVDRWNSLTAPTGTAGTTPSNGSTWSLVPGSAPNWWEALTTDATAPAATDTTLTSELTTNGLARAGMTYSHTASATSYALTKTFSCTGGSQTINKEALFNAQNGGFMSFESAEPSPPTLISGDSLQQTVTINM